MKFAQLLLQPRPALFACCLVMLIAAGAAALQQPPATTGGQSSPPPTASAQGEKVEKRASAGSEGPTGSALRERAWTMLKAGGIDENTQKRAAAVRVLGLVTRDPQAETIAERALSDKEPEVRAAAAEALGQMEAKKYRRKLRRVLNDKDPEVVFAAANSLRAMGDRSAYRVYYAVLTGNMKAGRGLIQEQGKMLKDPKKLALFGFEQGIGQIPFAGVGYHAFKALKKDDTSPVRAAAAKALSRDPDPRAAAALTKAATSDTSWLVRVAALDALAHRDDASLLPKIAPALDDQRDEVRVTAAATVVRLSRPEKRVK